MNATGLLSPDPILAIVQEVADADAVIAGGFVRDTILHRDPKDVDIWYHSGVPAEDLIDTILCRRADAFLVQYEPSYDGVEKRVESVIKITDGGKNYDLIAVDAPIGYRASDLLNRFDIGLCMVAYNNREILFSPKFHDDRWGRVLTVYTDNLSDHDLRATLTNHLKRMRQKFPGYDVQFV